MLDLIPVHLYDSYFKTGSSVICSPPVLDTDIDIMMFTNDYDELYHWLIMNNWITQYGDYMKDDFKSFRYGKTNLLITDDINYYDRFEEATKIATKLNLLEKSQRITLFAYIVRGEID